MKTLLPAAIALLLAAACRAADTTTQPTPPASIATVHTWGDLLAQKPIALEMPSTGTAQRAGAIGTGPLIVRVGIDSSEVARHGYSLLYCVAESANIAASLNSGIHASDSVGPFFVVLKRPDAMGRDIALWMDESAHLSSRPLVGLYMIAVPMHDAGAYTVTLARAVGDAKAQEIASTKITVPSADARSDPTWLPWSHVDNIPQPTADSSEFIEWFAAVTNAVRGMALPICESRIPVLLAKRPDAAIALPQLIDDVADADCVLKMADGELILTFAQARQENDSYQYAKEYFLTRWWVNGKPFIPSTVNESGIGAGGGPILNIRRIHFQLAFRAAALGVKKGDKVGVQLLYCPNGWESGGRVQAAMQFCDQPTLPDAPPRALFRPSNRIDFIYSGDPAHPKQ